MFPRLALGLCLLFGIWLIVRDVRRRPSVSKAIWIPILLLLILESRPLSLWLAGGLPAGAGTDYMEGSPADRAFYLALIGSAFAVTLARGVNWGEVIRTNPGIFLFYGYLGLSVIWSDYTFVSFKRWFKDFGSIAIILVLLSEKNPLEAIRALYVRCAYLLIPLSVVFIKYYPELGRAYTAGGQPMSTGVTMQKNSLGELVLISGLFLVWDYLEARPRGGRRWSQIPWDRVLIMLMGLWLLRVSDSKTSMVCLLVGVGLLVRPQKFASAGINRLILIAALVMPLLVLVSSQFPALFTPVVQLLGRDLTFTGRTDIWQAMLRQPTNPLIGEGFYSFYLGDGAQQASEDLGVPQLMNTAHNGYLDTYLDGGMLGVTLLVLVLLGVGAALSNSMGPERYQRLRFAFLVVSIFYNISESMFGRLTPVWFTTVLVLTNLPRRGTYGQTPP